MNVGCFEFTGFAKKKFTKKSSEDKFDISHSL